MESIVSKMENVSGTVFFYCLSRDEKSISAFTRAAEQTGRRLFRREDCRELEPEALAGSPGEKAIFVLPNMMDFLDRYLAACPGGLRHLVIQACREGERCPMGFPFHDFWEERDVDIENFYTEAASPII